MALALRNVFFLGALLYGAAAQAADECASGEQCDGEDIEESALLQTKVEKHGVGSSPKGSEDPGEPPLGSSHPGNERTASSSLGSGHSPAQHLDTTHQPQTSLLESLAKFDDLQAKVKMVRGAVLTQNATSDPDEADDKDAQELLSTASCPAQPEGWHICAWGRVFTQNGGNPLPAYCASNNRLTLNNGEAMNFKGCAFLTAQTSGCSNYFYTTSTSDSAGGVCKCCKQGPSESPYYKSSQCNYVYYASSSCKIN